MSVVLLVTGLSMFWKIAGSPHGELGWGMLSSVALIGAAMFAIAGVMQWARSRSRWEC